MAKIKKYIKSEFLEELQETLQKQGSFAEKKSNGKFKKKEAQVCNLLFTWPRGVGDHTVGLYGHGFNSYLAAPPATFCQADPNCRLTLALL